jgi:hypothetical protein
MSRSIIQYLSEQDDTEETDSSDETPTPSPEEKKGFVERTLSSLFKKAPEVAKDAMKQNTLGQKITTRNDMLARINAGKD